MHGPFIVKLVSGHAFFPEFGGDIHMDDSEFWTVDLEVGETEILRMFKKRNIIGNILLYKLGMERISDVCFEYPVVVSGLAGYPFIYNIIEFDCVFFR